MLCLGQLDAPLAAVLCGEAAVQGVKCCGVKADEGGVGGSGWISTCAFVPCGARAGVVVGGKLLCMAAVEGEQAAYMKEFLQGILLCTQ